MISGLGQVGSVIDLVLPHGFTPTWLICRIAGEREEAAHTGLRLRINDLALQRASQFQKTSNIHLLGAQLGANAATGDGDWIEHAMQRVGQRFATL